MPQPVLLAIIALVSAAIGSGLTYVAAERKLRAERKFERALGNLLKKLLSVPEWRSRKFSTLQRNCKGVPDDQLRQALISAGAICLETQDGEEIWGLIDRVKENLSPDPDGYLGGSGYEIKYAVQAPADDF